MEGKEVIGWFKDNDIKLECSLHGELEYEEIAYVKKWFKGVVIGRIVTCSYCNEDLMIND